MTSKWIEIANEPLDPDVEYFLGRPDAMEHWMFVSCDLRGRVCMSGKPGIAVRIKGAEVPEILAKNPNAKLQVVRVPPDADRRWKARQHRRGAP